MHKCFSEGIMLLICLLSTSCASILNKRDIDVFVYTGNPAEIVYESDTIGSKKAKGFNIIKLTVPRSTEPLRFAIKNDSIGKNINIESQISFLYYMNIVPPMWPGLAIDLSSPKRYTYKNILLFDDSLNLHSATNSSTIVMQRERENLLRKNDRSGISKNERKYSPQKGDLYLNLSSPILYPGYTILKPAPGLSPDRVSALGFAGGLDYYYKNNRFINLTASATFGGDITIGCGDFGYDDEERFDLYHITASHNHRYKIFSFGYGISHAYTDWWTNKYYFTDSPLKINNINNKPETSIMRYNEERKYATLGLVFNGYIYFFNSFTIGVIYKPTFVRLNSIMEKRFCYEHQISFDMAFKIRLYRKK